MTNLFAALLVRLKNTIACGFLLLMSRPPTKPCHLAHSMRYLAKMGVHGETDACTKTTATMIANKQSDCRRAKGSNRFGRATNEQACDRGNRNGAPIRAARLNGTVNGYPLRSRQLPVTKLSTYFGGISGYPSGARLEKRSSRMVHIVSAAAVRMALGYGLSK